VIASPFPRPRRRQDVRPGVCSGVLRRRRQANCGHVEAAHAASEAGDLPHLHRRTSDRARGARTKGELIVVKITRAEVRKRSWISCDEHGRQVPRT